MGFVALEESLAETRGRNVDENAVINEIDSSYSEDVVIYKKGVRDEISSESKINDVRIDRNVVEDKMNSRLSTNNQDIGLDEAPSLGRILRNSKPRRDIANIREFTLPSSRKSTWPTAQNVKGFSELSAGDIEQPSPKQFNQQAVATRDKSNENNRFLKTHAKDSPYIDPEALRPSALYSKSRKSKYGQGRKVSALEEHRLVGKNSNVAMLQTSMSHGSIEEYPDTSSLDNFEVQKLKNDQKVSIHPSTRCSPTIVENPKFQVSDFSAADKIVQRWEAEEPISKFSGDAQALPLRLQRYGQEKVGGASTGRQVVGREGGLAMTCMSTYR